MTETGKQARAAMEFWFDFGSNYSYLSVMRIEALARQAGVDLHWRPFLLGPIFREQGWSTSPFVLQAEKGRYVWTDMQRQARKYGLEFHQPSVFPRNAVLALRVALLGVGQPWIGAYCQAVMRQNFVEDLDIGDPLNVRRALHGLVDDIDALIEQAQSDANKQRLREQTETARQRGIFGAPTFFVNGQMFWGDDRLDDAVACAQQPWATQPLTLQGEVVRLEPLTLAHAEALAQIGLEPALWQWQPKALASVDDMRAYVGAALADHARGSALPFAIVLQASGEIIGTTRYMDIAAPHRRLEIGATWLGLAHQRSGANTEAKRLLLAHAFETLGARRVVFKTEALNTQSRAALARIGAQEEGTFRQHLTTASGRARDMVYFAILDNDWPQVREHLAALSQRRPQPQA